MNRAVDSHCHVFDPARFPFGDGASYRPTPQESGTVEQLAAMLELHGITHALLVNPTSGYGYDNRYLVATLRSCHGRFKGIARVAPGVEDAALASLAAAGVIGVRFDLIGDGAGVLYHEATPRLLERIRELQWQIHVQCERDQLAAAAPLLRAARVPLVIDHCGRPDVASDAFQPGFQALLDLGREGHAVKLSGPFRFSRLPAPHADVEPFVASIIETFTPARCVWGSDWPFLRLQDRPDYGSVLAFLKHWIPREDDRRQVLWDTPARLFGF